MNTSYKSETGSDPIGITWEILIERLLEIFEVSLFFLLSDKG